MKIKTNLTYLFLTIYILAGTNFLNLVSIPETIGIKRDDFLLLLMLFFLGIQIVKNGFVIKFNKKDFFLVFGPMILGVCAAITSTIFFGQSLIDGIIAQRVFMFMPLSFVWCNMLLSKDDIEISYLKNIILMIAKIELILLLIQCFLYPYVSFLQVSIPITYRAGYGQYRLRSDLLLITISFFIMLNEVLKKNSVTTNIIWLFLTLVLLIKFVLTRMIIIGYLLSMIMAVIIWKPKNKKYKILMFFVIGLGLVCFMYTETFQNIINTILNKSDTLVVRANGRDLYLSALINSPIFGKGYAHENCVAAIEAAGINLGIYTVDNGILGFAYTYGLLGILWLLHYWYRFYSYARMNFRNKDYSYILYLVYIVAISFTILFIQNYGFVFFLWSLLFCMMKYSNVSQLDK